MGEKMSEYNKPIDRDYFKRKDNPKWNAEKKVTPCCEQPIDEDFKRKAIEERTNKMITSACTTTKLNEKMSHT